MAEREPITPPEQPEQQRYGPKFGEQIPQAGRNGTRPRSAAMFPDGADLPLFSGTPIPAIERPFVPEDHSMKQLLLPGMPAIDYGHVLEKDRELRRLRSTTVVPTSGDIFVAAATSNAEATERAAEPMPHQEAAGAPAPTKRERRR
jgi:hypothetical protein